MFEHMRTSGWRTSQMDTYELNGATGALQLACIQRLFLRGGAA